MVITAACKLLRHVPGLLRELLVYVWTYVVCGEACSYPGGPRERPLLRRGKWPDEDRLSTAEWSFAEAEASHEVTLASDERLKLTGEAAGRQIWHQEEGADAGDRVYRFNPAENPNSSDQPFREIMIEKWLSRGKEVPDTESTPSSAREAAVKGLQFYQMIQCEDGHWAGDYGGPMFLMPGLITVLYITKAPFPQARKDAMARYLRNHQQLDGGWGTHIECASTMFGTVLSYLSLRLLGEPSDSECMTRGRSFIHSHGGALYSPSWCKFWLAVLGLYEWDGINSIPTEMWFLPRWCPLHPGKMWCHARMVYLPMGFLYSSRFSPNLSNDPLINDLRKELYVENYDTICWDDFRQSCADIDNYSPLNPVMRFLQDCLSYYEYFLPYVPFLVNMRKQSLEYVMDYIHAEDSQTNFVDIGPVNKALNMLCVYVESGCDSSNENFLRHLARIDDYLWVAEDGMKMQGYNGSQCWDTSFAVQAIVEGNLVERFPECSRKIYDYLRRTQIANDEVDREKYFRQVSKGGWPFSTAAHGWPISDCTSEGLKAVLAIHSVLENGANLGIEHVIDDSRLFDAVNVILELHNEDGGWATYENNRGYRWYELMNPSEVFGDIMIDYSYVECTSACITALSKFHRSYPEHRTNQVLNAIEAGRQFLHSIQRPDGSWYGSWGVCMTYGTWFGIEGLISAGEDPDSPAIQKALSFLLDKQNPNGGWGESYVACVDKAYPSDGTGQYGEDGSGVVQTSWAVLALIAGSCENRAAIDAGIRFIRKKQLASGDWAQEGITGVFNRSCGITYTAYRNVFTIWALVRYANAYESSQ